MPLIKPRTRGKQFVRLITRLDRENNETLYLHFIGESAEYVLNQPVESLLAKDKEFIAARGAPRLVCATPSASAPEADPGVAGCSCTADVPHASAASSPVAG